MHSLKCSNISLSFDNENKIISNLSFSTSSGEKVLIKGKNGSGKTTLLKSIAGLINCYKGSIECNGKIVFIGHKIALKSDLTVFQNLNMWANFYGNQEIVLPTIYCFFLNDVLDVRLKYLSEGWKKRIALSRSLISNADIWLLDEPYVNLDAEFKIIFNSIIDTRINQKGIVIFTSHINSEISVSKIIDMDE